MRTDFNEMYTFLTAVTFTGRRASLFIFLASSFPHFFFQFWTLKTELCVLYKSKTAAWLTVYQYRWFSRDEPSIPMLRERNIFTTCFGFCVIFKDCIKTAMVGSKGLHRLHFKCISTVYLGESIHWITSLIITSQCVIDKWKHETGT